MIVSEENNRYTIIMADSGASEVVIKMKERVAREVRDELDSLLPKTDIERVFDREENEDFTNSIIRKMDRFGRQELLKLQEIIHNELEQYNRPPSNYNPEESEAREDEQRRKEAIQSQDIEVGVCKLKSKFCEHALRKSGYYPNNKEIGYGATFKGRHTEESKALMREHNAMKRPESRKKLSDTQKIRRNTPEEKERQSKLMRGCNNPCFNDGHSLLYWSHFALKKDKCELCGSDNYLDIHHEPRINWHSDNWKTWEGRVTTLCKSCHTRRHDNGKNYKHAARTDIPVREGVGIIWTIERTKEALKDVIVI